MGHRQRRRGPQGRRQGTGNAERFSSAGEEGRPAQPGNRPRHGVSVLARSPLRDIASGVVSLAAGWDRAVRREPAEEIRRHPAAELRDAAMEGALGGAARRGPLLDRPGRADLSRGQPAHQAVRVLGVADRRGAPPPPRCAVSGRSVHTAEGHAASGEGRASTSLIRTSPGGIRNGNWSSTSAS